MLLFYLTRKWAMQMQEELVQLIDAETGIQELQKIFLQFRNHYNVKQNNATQLVAKAAREIEKLLASRSKALEALATAAENLQKEHQWKDDLDFDINDTETRHNRVKLEFKEDPAFKRSVSYSTTAVHIPTDIYEGSTIILNELNWTAALDDVFKKNKEDDPSLLWQVFGSASGLARYFPASPWVDTKNTPNKIDLYDVRRRPWYIQVHTLTDTNPPSCSREDRASEIFEEYNSEKKVRIFTFSVGQHNYDKTPIQWMACNNKGEPLKFNEYLDVLGRPMVKEYKKAKSVQWTNVYVDALELGLVITGTLPVFNKTSTRKSQDKNKAQSQLILGVMAIDVSLDDIKRLTPHYTLGPNGYYFAIDPNGYVLLHPNLQPKDLKSQEPVTLDLLDAELEDEVKVEVRANFYDVLSYRYIDRGIRTYTWGPVHDTDYSLALVLPDYSVSYIKATIVDTITQAKCKYHNSHSRTFIKEIGMTVSWPQRDYCTDLKAQSDNNTQFLTDFIEYIDIHTPNHSPCQGFIPLRIRAKFVVTDGGVTRVYPASAGSEWTEQAETYKSSFYKRSLDNNIFVFTSSPYAFNETQDSILVSRAMDLRVDEFMLKPAVVGVKLDKQTWMESFINATITPKVNCIYLFLSKNLDCFLLDDGGFLVMTNKDLYINKIGQFFGMIDPSLMRNLINESLFSVNITYDYQALCEPTKETKAAAGLRSVYVPTIADILTIGWWASAAACSWQLNINCVLFTADLDDDLSEMPSKESCIKEQKQYFFENDETTFKGTIDCQNCSRQFIAEKLPKTNLVLIVADTKEPCSPGPDPCEIAQNPRYRKGPTQCFENNASEQNEDCGGASSLSPSIVSMVILQLPLLWLLIGRGHCLS
uniref:Calcium channel, voltage-dependent, alpha 2/delta subunit 1a n=1 Tax=Sinocyclocheilus anshuiensis TaxID=1608454 RepID=A0A671LIT4_9TELE